MEIATAIHQRRSIKCFDPDHRMTEAEVRQLLGLVRLSPTAFNLQHWRFVVVQDPDLRREVRRAAADQAQVEEASLLLVLCADLHAWQRDPARYWAADAGLRERMAEKARRFYAGDERRQRDEAMRSCGIAAGVLMLAALHLGYDTCPMIGFDVDAVGRLVRLPDDHVITMMIAVGKASQPARTRGVQLPLEELMIRDRFPEQRS
ncbi:MAG: nitroreductase family protein [Candidatus Krumholzibacteriia bacterium]